MSNKKIFVDSTVKPFTLTGLYFKVMQASGEISLEFDMANGEIYETGLSAGQGVRFEQKYKSVRISSTISQQIIVWSGLGQLTQDSRSTTVIAGSSGIASDAVSLTANTSKQIAPSLMGRRSILVQGDEPFFIGGSEVSIANGLPVDGNITLETQGEVWAISETAQVLRTLEEFN